MFSGYPPPGGYPPHTGGYPAGAAPPGIPPGAPPNNNAGILMYIVITLCSKKVQGIDHTLFTVIS